jgi:ABC-type transport system involved in multi-copper enzyme maturation permease subunit
MTFMALLRRSAAQAKLVLLGGIVVLAIFQLVIIAQAAEIQRSNAFGRAAEFIPAFLQRGLGQQALLLATFKGTVSFGYFHPVIVCLLSVIAIYIATEPAHEVESGLADLVLARSLRRHRVITRSLVLSMAAVATIAVAMVTGTVIGLRLFAPDDASIDPRVIANLVINLTAVAWCCGAIGLFLGANARRWTTAFATGVFVVVVGYLLDFLAIGWEPAKAVSWLFPFEYFPALLIIGGTASMSRDLAVLGSATIALAALAYWRFERRDL